MALNVLKAVNIFYKYAQELNPAYQQLLGLSNKLADPNAVQNPDNTIDSALLSTLQQEVDKMEYQERFPITRPEAKAVVRTLYNYDKQFHFNLVNKKDISLLISDFRNVRNDWDKFRTNYLSDQFLNELELAKGEAAPENQPDFDKRINFWKRLITQSEDTVSNIEKLLNDQLTGNAEIPLSPTPV